MQLNIKKRDGPARIRNLTVEDKMVIIPNILFVDTGRFKAPVFADLFLTNEKTHKQKPIIKMRENNSCISNCVVYPDDISQKLYSSESKDDSADMFIVANAHQLFQQSKKFTEFITDLREKIGYDKTIYTPTIGTPSSLALLTYMGVDFFDSTSAITAARNNTLLFAYGNYKKDELIEIPCSCPVCSKFNGKPSEMKFQDILNHNYYVLLSEMKQVRNSINNGNLRNLVEIRIKTSPNLCTILRTFDNHHYDFLEKRTAITSKQKLIATTKESLVRPEIKRFQQRVINRYRKPDSTRVLLLLPCSAKKPYSFSKSHHFFRERIMSSHNPFVVHEVIITSPLGLVPRELELVYPACAYDIPVTGIWDEDEKKMIRNMLSEYLKQNKYDKIIVHLPSGITDFINDILGKNIVTCIDHPTSNESLEHLSDVLKETVKDFDRVKPALRQVEDVKCFATYQFGRKIANKLLKGCNVRGRYPSLKIMDKQKQLGMIIKDRGLISLTLDGAMRVIESDKYWVEIFDDFTLKGSVFAPGVKDADINIRVGDEVVVKRNNNLCAVGVAMMNGDEMKSLSFGEAVKVRHKE
jgi:archaeosine synthase